MSIAIARSSGVPSIALTSFWKCFGCTLCAGTPSEWPSDEMNSSNSSTFSRSGASWMRNSDGVP